MPDRPRRTPPRDLSSFRVRTVFDVYRSAPDALAVDAFGEALSLRRDGFAGWSALPVDGTDLVGWHHLVSMADDAGEEHLVAAFKGVLLSQCDAAGISLPILDVARAADGGAGHAARLAAIVAEHRRDRAPLVYAGGYTIRDRFRRSRAAVGPILELVVALVADDAARTGARRTLCGGIAGRSTRLFRRMGCTPIEAGGQTVLPHPHAPGADVSFFELTALSPWGRACVDRCAEVLSRRIELGYPPRPPRR